MGIVQSLKQRMFVPGEPIRILGFNHNASTVRLYDGWIKYANGLGQNTFKNENGDLRGSRPYMFMGRYELPKGLLQFVGKKKCAVESITNDEGQELPITVKYYETNEPYFNEQDGTYYLKIDPKLAPIMETGDSPEGLLFPMDFETATGVSVEGKPFVTELPARMFGFIRDPILRYYKTNPELYGVSADVALSAGLLRVKVQWWKTILFCLFAFGLGLMM